MAVLVTWPKQLVFLNITARARAIPGSHGPEAEFVTDHEAIRSSVIEKLGIPPAKAVLLRDRNYLGGIVQAGQYIAFDIRLNTDHPTFCTMAAQSLLQPGPLRILIGVHTVCRGAQDGQPVADPRFLAIQIEPRQKVATARCILALDLGNTNSALARLEIGENRSGCIGLLPDVNYGQPIRDTMDSVAGPVISAFRIKHMIDIVQTPPEVLQRHGKRSPESCLTFPRRSFGMRAKQAIRSHRCRSRVGQPVYSGQPDTCAEVSGEPKVQCAKDSATVTQSDARRVGELKNNLRDLARRFLNASWLYSQESTVFEYLKGRWKETTIDYNDEAVSLPERVFAQWRDQEWHHTKEPSDVPRIFARSWHVVIGNSPVG